MEIIAVFASRTHTMQFVRCMRASGASATVINTPRQIMSSCGVSAVFRAGAISVARRCITMGRFTSFKGFYQKIVMNNTTHYVVVKNV